MRPELKRLILNARARLGGYELPADQAEENARQQAIEDFKLLLAPTRVPGVIYQLAGPNARGCPCNLIRAPFLRNSAVRRSTSKGPN
jgi:hypothetical protein